MSIEWAAGQLDGDGCIGVYGSNGVVVTVGKSVKNIQTLHELQRLFGGFVNKVRDARGNQCEVHQWTTRGPAAQRVCQVMQSHLKLKKKQAVLATQYKSMTDRGNPIQVGDQVFRSEREFQVHAGLIRSTVTRFVKCGKMPNGDMITVLDKKKLKSDQQFVNTELRRLKTVPHDKINEDLPIPYVAGFFDAEGCIEVSYTKTVRVSISQKHPAICEAFKSQFGGSVLKNGHRGWRWSKNTGALQFLQQISAFSIEKLPQIFLVLNTKDFRSVENKQALSILKGNQNNHSPPNPPDQ